MTPFLAALLALCAVSALAGNPRLLGTAIILLTNWTLNTAVVQWTGDPFPWPWFLATDYLSGFVVLLVGGRPKAWQIAVTAMYAFQCVAHGWYGLSVRGPWQNYYYWYVLSYVAWAQVYVIGTWCLAELARRFGVSFRRASSDDVGMARDRRGPPEP